MTTNTVITAPNTPLANQTLQGNTFNGANQLVQTDGNGNIPMIPARVVWPYAGTSVPSGWLVCDFSAVSRTIYSALFAAIGTTQGAGNGSTTFNLPNLAGRVIIGSGSGAGLTSRTIGTSNIGAETHSLKL